MKTYKTESGEEWLYFDEWLIENSYYKWEKQYDILASTGVDEMSEKKNIEKNCPEK